MIFPNKMQFEVLQKPKDKNVTLIMNGAGAGNTTTLLLAALKDESEWVTFLFPSDIHIQQYSDIASKWLLPLGFRYSSRSRIYTGTDGKKIALKSYGTSIFRIPHGSICVDGANFCSSIRDYLELVNEFNCNLYMTASLLDVYLEDPPYTSIFFDYDEDDCTLSPDKVKPWVHLVTGYSMCEELVEICPQYLEELKSLPEKEKIALLHGEWVN